MIVAITRLRLGRLRDMPGFLIASRRCILQARKTEGFVRGKTWVDRKLTFWTVTVWADLRSMQKFMATEVHLQTMPRSRDWCVEGVTMHREVESSEFPPLPELVNWLKEHGKYFVLPRPTADQQSKRFDEPRILFESVFKAE